MSYVIGSRSLRPYSVGRGLAAFLISTIIGTIWVVIGVALLTTLMVSLSSVLYQLLSGPLLTWGLFPFPLFWLAGMWGIWKIGAIFLERRKWSIGFLSSTFGNDAPIFQRLDARLALAGYSLSFWGTPIGVAIWLCNVLSHIKWPC